MIFFCRKSLQETFNFYGTRSPAGNNSLGKTAKPGMCTNSRRFWHWNGLVVCNRDQIRGRSIRDLRSTGFCPSRQRWSSSSRGLKTTLEKTRAPRFTFWCATFALSNSELLFSCRRARKKGMAPKGKWRDVVLWILNRSYFPRLFSSKMWPRAVSRFYKWIIAREWKIAFSPGFSKNLIFPIIYDSYPGLKNVHIFLSCFL